MLATLTLIWERTTHTIPWFDRWVSDSVTHPTLLLLDYQNGLIGTQVISIGTATETLAHPRDIFREVIKQGAAKIIVSHNHPSGNLEPSQEDILLTEQLLQGGNFLKIPILDHLILGNGDHHSLRQSTDLWDRYPQDD